MWAHFLDSQLRKSFSHQEERTGLFITRTRKEDKKGFGGIGKKKRKGTCSFPLTGVPNTKGGERGSLFSHFGDESFSNNYHWG